MQIVYQIIYWGLILGSFISFTPQYHRIWSRESVDGVNEYMIILGLLSCLFTLDGYAVLNKTMFSDCNDDCYSFYLSFIQLLSPLICYIILYAVFYHYHDNFHHDIRLRLYCVIIISLIFSIVSGLINSNFEIFADTMGILSAITSVAMWIPQIRTSMKLGGAGSLSVLALSIHALGCLLTIICQVISSHQKIILLAGYIIGFLLETFLVIWLLCKKKRKKYIFYNVRFRSQESHINNNPFLYDNDNRASVYTTNPWGGHVS